MDPISDMFTRIRNAAAVGKKTVSFPFSKFKWAVLQVMKDTDYVGDIARKGRKNRKVIEVDLRYDTNGGSVISEIRPVSKQSRRVYQGSTGMRPARQGTGIYIVSTSRGVMTSEAARKARVGGEVVCEVW